MYYKVHPPVTETTDSILEHHQTLAYLAELETLLLEFEHSEEFGACGPHYLGSPKIILTDFIHETGLPSEELDPEALQHGLLTVLPSRFRGLISTDAHQILREQISFWRFADVQWQLKYAAECLSILNPHLRNKLHKIIGLEGIEDLQHEWTPGHESTRALMNDVLEQDVYSVPLSLDLKLI